MNIFNKLLERRFLSPMMMLCLATGLCVTANTALGAENLVVNGTFDSGIEGWRAWSDNADALPSISFVADDGVGDKKGCLKVSFDKSAGDMVPWTLGAIMNFSQQQPPNFKVKISFSAKSLKGSRKLLISRPSGGGATEAVEMTDKWQQFEVQFSSKFETPFLAFAIIDPSSGKVDKGEFLLDNVSITTEPAK